MARCMDFEQSFGWMEAIRGHGSQKMRNRESLGDISSDGSQRFAIRLEIKSEQIDHYYLSNLNLTSHYLEISQ